MDERIELRVVSTPQHVSVTQMHPGSVTWGTSVAEASEITPDDYRGKVAHWYVNRVKVHDKHQGKGVGSRILRHLVNEIVHIYDGQIRIGEIEIFVEPGGYGSDPKRLNKFYKQNGFEVTSNGVLVFHGEKIRRW